MDYIDFYHYTSESGKKSIIACGYILENSKGDRHAHFGRGVYGTSLSPSSGKYTIAFNNWKGHGRHYIRNGSCDWAIKVRIPSDQVKSVGPSDRDILVYREQLNLNDFTYEAIKVPF